MHIGLLGNRWLRPFFSLRWNGRHLHTGQNTEKSLDHDPFSSLQTFLDEPFLAPPHTRTDRTQFRLVVLTDDEHEGTAGSLLHRTLRYQDGNEMARDLREILAALRIASDIERIGDYASNAAKRSMALNEYPVVSASRGLSALAGLAAQMLRDVLAAYRARDAEAALVVRARDAELDARYTALFRELLTYMAEDPRSISPAIHLLFIAKNIERIGDHATNIAENVWFIVHGELPVSRRRQRDTASG